MIRMFKMLGGMLALGAILLGVGMVLPDSASITIILRVIGGGLIFIGILGFFKPSLWRLGRVVGVYDKLTGDIAWDAVWKSEGGALALDATGKRVLVVDPKGKGAVFQSHEILGYSSSVRTLSRTGVTMIPGPLAVASVNTSSKSFHYVDVKTSNYDMPLLRVWFGKHEGRMDTILAKLSLICDLR